MKNRELFGIEGSLKEVGRVWVERDLRDAQRYSEGPRCVIDVLAVVGRGTKNDSMSVLSSRLGMLICDQNFSRAAKA